MSTSNDHLLKGAMVSAIANAIINGIINWFQVKDHSSILLTADSISSTQHTVFSGSVILAVTLAFILSTIAYFTTKSESKPPYFPEVFKLAVKHSVFSFGIVVILGLLVQRVFGSIEVSPTGSAVVAGIIAGLVGGIVDYETKRSITSQPK